MNERRREEILIDGRVQGIGFRPFVYCLAVSLNLRGSVRNSSAGVCIDAEGSLEVLDLFLSRLEKEKPAGAVIHSMKRVPLPLLNGRSKFEILPSLAGGKTGTEPFPDLATCSDCLRELFDPASRRFRYPFTNCTRCGPRYSIISSLPYDRCRTSMRRFVLCPDCEKEYHDPADRRFHAEPNACPDCGPRLRLSDFRGKSLGCGPEALEGAIRALQAGDILAVKGLGGFHFMADACREEPIRRLRAAKERGGKPFAIMAPSLAWVGQACSPSRLEIALLTSAAAPIVLIPRAGNRIEIAPSVVPAKAVENPYLGVMLAHTPLHHLLMERLGTPLVATSGNFPGEPVCFNDEDAMNRFSEVARYFLSNDRPIVRPVEDSVVREIAGKVSTLRCGRGYAPLSLSMETLDESVLGSGGETKCSLAYASNSRIYLGPPLGKIGTETGLRAYQSGLKEIPVLFGNDFGQKACDLHPSYLSSRMAKESGIEVREIQHHHAHIVSCMAEHGLDDEVLGVAWDGSGFGPDGTVWGGEFLRADRKSFSRMGRFRPFPLFGGEQAVREPRRAAFALVWSIFGEAALQMTFLPVIRSFAPSFFENLVKMSLGQFNTPLTSSVGRLFDAVASLTGLCQTAGYEGEGGMLLEFSAKGRADLPAYEIPLVRDSDLPGGGLRADWEPMIRQMVQEIRCGVPVEAISLRFHHSLAESVIRMARESGLEKVVLTGGCFQNRVLAERCVRRLVSEGFIPFLHQRVPANDWGLSVGQAVAAAAMIKEEQNVSCNSR